MVEIIDYREIPETTEASKKHFTRQTRADPIPTRKLTGYALVAAKAAARSNLPPPANPWFRSKAIFIGKNTFDISAHYSFCFIGEPLPTVATIEMIASSTPHFTDTTKDLYFHEILPAKIAYVYY